MPGTSRDPLGPSRNPVVQGWGQFLARLFAAGTRSEMADVAVAEAARVFGCRDSVVLWCRSTAPGAPRTWHGYPRAASAEDLALLAQAPTDDAVPGSQGAGRFARRLLPADNELDICLIADWPATGPEFEHLWAEYRTFVQVRVAKALELEQQHRTAQTLQEAARLQSALYSIADLASGGLDMPDMLRQIHAIVGTLIYAENFLIVLYNPEHDTLRFIYFADMHQGVFPNSNVETPASQMGASLTLAMMRRGQSAMGPSARLRAEFGLQKAAAFGPDSADWLGVPMLGDSGVCGAVVVQSYDRPDCYRSEDQALLAFVAQHILTALQRKQAQEELERRVEARTAELRVEVQERERGEALQAALYAIAELSSSERDMSDMLGRIHDVVRQLMYAENFFIVLRNLERQTLRFIYFADVKDSGLVNPAEEIPEAAMDSSRTLALMRHGRPIRGAGRELASQLGVAVPGGAVVGTPAVDWLGVPMTDDGQVRGAVVVQSYDPTVPRYTEEDSALLAYVAQHILTALARKQTQVELERRVHERTQDLANAVGRLEEEIGQRELVEQKLTYEALHDSLTGLPNRSYLVEALERSLSRLRTHPGHSFAVLFLDLDRFKVINDSVGHLVGDELLKLAGIRLTACVPSHGVVARLGGDEFAILLEHGVDTHAACQVARRIIDAISEPMAIAGKELFSSASVGIVMSDPRYNSTDELLRDADFAMYRAKAAGRQRFEIFDERLHSETLRALDTEGDLRRALIRSEFEPYFQPIVRLADGHTVGYEALIRWHHPERGLLLPEDFLSLAEESGSVEQIDWQMFDKTCQHVLALVTDGQYVTFNLSPRHFRSPDLPGRFLALLAMHGIAPRLARIEVTEGTLLENPEQVCTMIAELREGGILVALDDFGTGYSSLSYLNRFPLHALKIDRSFVASLRPGGTAASTAIVRAVLALARTLGLEVVAEGVETQDQRQCLLDLGCEFGQGFLFAEAQPVRQRPS